MLPDGTVRADNPRWLAVLVTALPVALAAVIVPGSIAPDARRPPAAGSRHPTPPARPAALSAPDPNTTLVRAP